MEGAAQAYLLESVADDLAMLVHNVLLDERSSLEELLTALTSKLVVVFDLYVIFAESRQLPIISFISIAHRCRAAQTHSW